MLVLSHPSVSNCANSDKCLHAFSSIFILSRYVLINDVSFCNWNILRYVTICNMCHLHATINRYPLNVTCFYAVYLGKCQPSFICVRPTASCCRRYLPWVMRAISQWPLYGTLISDTFSCVCVCVCVSLSHTYIQCQWLPNFAVIVPLSGVLDVKACTFSPDPVLFDILNSSRRNHKLRQDFFQPRSPKFVTRQ
jgi:hypothetical protein